MDESEWVACGYPGHLVVSDRCRFHLHHRVGNYRVSTVGDFWPSRDEGPVTVGAGRLFETMIFRVEGDHVGEPVSWDELDGAGYNLANDAEAGHYLFCLKYAEENRYAGE